MTVQYIDIAHLIWGKDTVALKGNTTMKKLIPVGGTLLKPPRNSSSFIHIICKGNTIFFVEFQYNLDCSDPSRRKKIHSNIQSF